MGKRMLKKKGEKEMCRHFVIERENHCCRLINILISYHFYFILETEYTVDLTLNGF